MHTLAQERAAGGAGWLEGIQHLLMSGFGFHTSTTTITTATIASFHIHNKIKSDNFISMRCFKYLGTVALAVSAMVAGIRAVAIDSMEHAELNPRAKGTVEGRCVATVSLKITSLTLSSFSFASFLRGGIKTEESSSSSNSSSKIDGGGVKWV